MKLYYSFLFLSLFCQIPEAELLITSAKAEVTYAHGTVVVVQGRHHVHTCVRGEGSFDYALIRLADGERVVNDGGAEHAVFHFPKSALETGAYIARVTFVDVKETMEVPFFVLD